MSRHRWLEEESYNRCLWLTPHDLPFPNDAPSVLQLGTNVGRTIRDRGNPLPQTCRLAHIFHCSVQASMTLRQGCQDEIPHTHAAQFPVGEAMVQQVPPYGLGVEECTEALACISNLGDVQEAT
jgi:hypothetical protein